jgi:hypothetical protein
MRTTASQVRALAQIDSAINVDPYIETAHMFTNDLASCAQLDDTRLELIERHLAAHFAFMSGVVTGASIASKSIGGASTSYSRPQGSGKLTDTPYGLTAIQLDSSKCLVGILEGPITITWLGK